MYSVSSSNSPTIFPGGEATKLNSRRNLKIGRLCLSVCLAIAIITIGGYHFVLQSDLFLLKEISVIGNNRIPPDEIIKESGLVIGGDNIFSVPLDELAKKLEQKFSYVKNATLTKKMPGLITIRIAEREPVALVVHEEANLNVSGMQPSKNFLVDIEGFVLAIIKDVKSLDREEEEGREVGQLPIVEGRKSVPQNSFPNNIILVTYEGKQDDSIRPRNVADAQNNYPGLRTSELLGRQLDSPSIQLALGVIKHITDAAWELRHEVTSINANNPQKITLSLKDGSIAFLRAGYLLAGLENLTTVLLHRKNVEETGGYIDARYPDVVYCGGRRKDKGDSGGTLSNFENFPLPTSHFPRGGQNVTR